MVLYRVKQYGLEQGALEIEYIEEFFSEFEAKKTAEEIIARLGGREHLIVMAEAPLPDDPSVVAPVSYKVAHELRAGESDPKLRDLVERLRGSVVFDGQRILYGWIGGTRSDWRGQGHFRALTEQQEAWALEHAFDALVVKTKNRFYGMRSSLDRLGFDVIKYERSAEDNRESKLYLCKRISRDVLERHRTRRSVVEAGG
jgi:GNAT superfamily N-acetyltransferase